MTLHLGLGRPNLWQQPGEQSLPSNCAASVTPAPCGRFADNSANFLFTYITHSWRMSL